MATTIDVLIEKSGLTIEDIAEQSGLEFERVEAIALGRWTPNPNERQKIAGVFNTSSDEIGWGHNMNPRNIKYRRKGISKGGNPPSG
jgi:transcriptional regulator with XRE-family HTH domain